jgi:hypothetical protein
MPAKSARPSGLARSIPSILAPSVPRLGVIFMGESLQTIRWIERAALGLGGLAARPQYRAGSEE